MNFSDGHWKGPILDNHFHLDKSGRYLDAALDFKRAGGTDLVLVHKPDFNNLPLNKDQIRSSYEGTIQIANSVRVEMAIEFCDEQLAVGVGEVGRPHWDVGDEVMQNADELLIEILGMCKVANVPVQLHLDANGEKTNREISRICDIVGFPRFGAIHHHADGNVSKQFTHGLTSSVIMGKNSINEISKSIWNNEGGFLLETDYMDDPLRPGAVLGPKTVPKRTQQLASSLIGMGIDVESAISAIHIDLPNALYGEYE